MTATHHPAVRADPAQSCPFCGCGLALGEHRAGRPARARKIRGGVFRDPGWGATGYGGRDDSREGAHVPAIIGHTLVPFPVSRFTPNRDVPARELEVVAALRRLAAGSVVVDEKQNAVRAA